MSDEFNLLEGLDIDLPAAPQGGERDADNVFFGPYQLLQQVGVGGVARVMRARHIHPQYADRTFAIKVLHQAMSEDAKVVALFRREALVLSLLKHPNVVQTFEAGAQDRSLFIAMEYIDGRDLDNLLERCRAAKLDLPLPLRLHFVAEMLRGLGFAHELRDGEGTLLELVHRDVNPANVFVAFDGRIKLGDFGVASIAAGLVEKSRELAGKVGYFAPEQLEGGVVDHRVDLFAAGVMLFEMLCGVRLFAAEDVQEAMRLNRRAKIPRPSKLNPAIPPALERVLLTALERRPQARFASARVMLQALAPFLPAPASMQLAVAALMRRMFLPEHVQELQLREGLSGLNLERGSGQVVYVLSGEVRAQVAFRDLLNSRGFVAEAFASTAAVRAALAVRRPAVMLVDVGAAWLMDVDLRSDLAAAPRVALVAASEGLSEEEMARAVSLGACDVLFKPFNIDRVLSAMRVALVAPTAAPAGSSASLSGALPLPGARVLLISADDGLTTPLRDNLMAAGYSLEIVPGWAAALLQVASSTPDLVLADALAVGEGRAFVHQYRALSGMGLVPIMVVGMGSLLTPQPDIGLERARLWPRLGAMAPMLAAVAELVEIGRQGRTFRRYPVCISGEVRYSGRVFTSGVIDLSRGGLMLQCDHIPTVGTRMGVVLPLPGLNSSLNCVGQVMRVSLVKGTAHEVAQVGLLFVSFAGRSEAELIRFLQGLDTPLEHVPPAAEAVAATSPLRPSR